MSSGIDIKSREDDLREGFFMSHDYFLKSINSFAPCCEFLFPSDRGSDISFLELTNQVALFKIAQLYMDSKLKIYFKILSLKETHVWGNVSLRSSSLDKI